MWLRSLSRRRRRRLERDLDRGLRHHMDRRVRGLTADDIDEDEARRRASLELGGRRRNDPRYNPRVIGFRRGSVLLATRRETRAVAVLVVSAIGAVACGPRWTWRSHQADWERSIEASLVERPSWREHRQLPGGFLLQVDQGPPAIAAVHEGANSFLFDRDGQLPMVSKLPRDDPRARGFRAIYGRDLETCERLDARWYYCRVT